MAFILEMVGAKAPVFFPVNGGSATPQIVKQAVIQRIDPAMYFKPIAAPPG